MIDLAVRRLWSQCLSDPRYTSPVEVVRWLTAVQSQDYGAATWAIAQRTAGSTRAEIDQLCDAGIILRTHVLRPTWHFVVPDDIRWLLDLTGPRIIAGLGFRLRQLEIDPDIMARASAAFTAALSGGTALTARELGDVLRRSGVEPERQRSLYLLMVAELQGLITSGPRRGKARTYALLAERAPGARTLDRAESLAELVRRYFRSHGPAQIQDAAWWSGLPMKDIRTGIALAGTALAHQVLDGKDYWFEPGGGPAPSVTGVAHLLPNWDEYTVGYRDRSAAIDPKLPYVPTVFSSGGILSNVVTIGGLARGSWRRTTVGQHVRIDLRPVAPLSPVEVDAIGRVTDRMARFLGCNVDLRVVEL